MERLLHGMKLFTLLEKKGSKSMLHKVLLRTILLVKNPFKGAFRVLGSPKNPFFEERVLQGLLRSLKNSFIKDSLFHKRKRFSVENRDGFYVDKTIGI